MRHDARLGSIARYAVGWAVAAIAVAVLAIVLLRSPDDEVSLPPVRQTELVDAARAARCELRRETGRRRLVPAVTGPPAAPAGPDVYSRPPAARTLVGAMRRGLVVIRYRPPFSGKDLEQLRRVQQAVPTGTIVTPDPTMAYAVAVTAWRRLLGCGRFDDRTIDAIRLFRGRYIGSGPDS